ncbi:taste receptor type 2 member 16-like [Dendropsophus ebraccatus]|uniref:taste receptor type 2 member 16-like n=1 Tax=Dendropsophus ebraccatus TaxID=150705 RepID=UPI00383122CF
MVDSTQSDTMVLSLGILTYLELIALVTGLVIHSFIIAVNVNDWLKGRSMTPVDQVLTFLGISRMCTQCDVTLGVLMHTYYQANLFSDVAMLIMSMIFSFFTYANIWLTSLLSIVYCLKISTLRTRLFLYLRGMIDRRTVYFIVASVFLSIIKSFLPFSRPDTGMIQGGTNTTTIENPSRNDNIIYFLYSHTISASIPLLFNFISSILLFCSLYHHVTKMKISNNLSINLETYYSAMRFVAITFIYNFVFFIGYFADIIYYYLYCEDIVWLYSALGCLPALHSSYLIYRTAKLRSQMSKVLHNVIDFLFQRKDSETRENIKVVA